MKELISPEQANALMLVVLIASPIVGWAFGNVAKKQLLGLLLGLTVGIGNMVMWRLYNAITDRLGLDTVKNLFVNIFLFATIGIVAGILWDRFSRNQRNEPEIGPPLVGSALSAGTTDRTSDTSHSYDNALEPPRDSG